MAKKNFEKFRQDLERKKVALVYLFSGPQAELKKEALKLLTSALLPPGSESFNLDRREANQFEVPEMQNLVATLPWGAPTRIVALYNVDQLKLEQRHALAEVVEKVPETTCLVLTAEKIPETEILSKAIQKIGEVIEFSLVREEKLISRIEELVKKEGKSISPKAAEKLALAMGPDLYGLEREVEKLVTYIGERKVITEEEVEDLVSASPEFKAYQLIDFIAQGDVKDSVEITREVLLTEKYAGIITNQLLQDYFFLWRLFTFAGSKNDFNGLARHMGLERQVFRVSKYLNCSRNYNLAKIEAGLKKVTEAEKALRYSPISPQTLVEQLVVELCQLSGNRQAVKTGLG